MPVKDLTSSYSDYVTVFFFFIGNHHTTAGNHRSSGILPHIFRVIRVSVDLALGKSPAPKLQYLYFLL